MLFYWRFNSLTCVLNIFFNIYKWFYDILQNFIEIYQLFQLYKMLINKVFTWKFRHCIKINQNVTNIDCKIEKLLFSVIFREFSRKFNTFLNTFTIFRLLFTKIRTLSKKFCSVKTLFHHKQVFSCLDADTDAKTIYHVNTNNEICARTSNNRTEHDIFSVNIYLTKFKILNGG